MLHPLASSTDGLSELPSQVGNMVAHTPYILQAYSLYFTRALPPTHAPSELNMPTQLALEGSSSNDPLQ